MFNNFRLSMVWLHTWFGLVLGFVLMVVFFFGALSVFDREIDRWSIPATRFAPQPMPSFDKVLLPVFNTMQPSPESIARARSRVNGPMATSFPVATRWGAYTTHRDPVLGLFAGYELPNAKDPEDKVFGNRTIDPRNGTSLPDDRLKIGSQFFYPLHYSLHLRWKNIGYWVVGFASLMMLVALVTGVVMHRKIFREFFTFRPKKATQRSTLDLHNMTGVLALPFHFFFAFTGLVIFAYIYFPVTHTQLNPLHELHEKIEAKETGLPHDRAGVAAPLASVDAMVAEAQRRWAAKGMGGRGRLSGRAARGRRECLRQRLSRRHRPHRAGGRRHPLQGQQRRVAARRPATHGGRQHQHLPHRPAPPAFSPLAAALAVCAWRPDGLRVYRHGFYLLRRKAQEAARQTRQPGQPRGRCTGGDDDYRHAGRRTRHADRQPPAARCAARRLAGAG